MIILVPGLLALMIGFFAFRSRITGVYFSILTQAMTYALMLLFFRNETGFGGNNGVTDFKHILGFSLQEPAVKLSLYMMSGVALILYFLMWRYIIGSKLGRGTLVGAILGAFLVNGAKSWFTAAYPDLWLYFLGALFILTTLFLPGGVIKLNALFSRLYRKVKLNYGPGSCIRSSRRRDHIH